MVTFRSPPPPPPPHTHTHTHTHTPPHPPPPPTPTQTKTQQYNGPLYTDRQKRHIDYVARKINLSINRFQNNRFIPNDLVEQIFLGKTRNPSQIRSLTDRYYDRDWAHIERVIDGAAWDLGSLLDILNPEVLGARIRATQCP